MKNNYLLATTLFLAVLLIACDQTNDTTAFSTNNSPEESEAVLIKKAIENGDTLAYAILHDEYREFINGEFLPIARGMADKHHYQPAYYDTYRAILDSNGIRTFYLKDSLTEIPSQAIEYLIQGAKRGGENSLAELTQYYLSDQSVNKGAVNSPEIRKNNGVYLDSLRLAINKEKR